jgi:hypothetical protein
LNINTNAKEYEQFKKWRPKGHPEGLVWHEIRMVDNTQDNGKPGDHSDYKQYPLFLPKATNELPRSTQLLFEYGASAEGYFNTEAFIRNQFAVLMLFEFKFETERLLCIYDNSTVHRAMGEGALDANAMNLSLGGKQKPQHRTEWDGKMQEIGTKGIKIVLDRGEGHVAGWHEKG